MKLFSLKPARKNQDLYADLDALVTEPIRFKLHGKVHTIKPMTTKEFFLASSAWAKFVSLIDEKNKNGVTEEQLTEMYTELLQTVCPTITKKDVEQMEQTQWFGVLNLIMETMTGKAQTPDYQKKKYQTSEVTSVN